jgi:hypothetical protein
MPLAGSTRPPRTEPAGDAVQDGADRDAAYVMADLGRAGDGMLAIVRLWVDGAPDRPVSHVTGSYVHIQ